MTSNRWWTVVATAIGLSVGNGAMASYSFGTFIKTIADENGWSRAAVSGAVGLYMGALALGTPAFGAMADRFGLRGPAIISITIFAILIGSVSFVTTLPMFLALFAMMGLTSGGATPLPYAKAISLRFDTRRGLALGLGTAGVGAGGVLLPQISAYLLRHYGWRGGYVGLGVLAFVVAVPAAYFGLRPQFAAGAAPQLKAATVQAPPTRHVARDWRLWLIAVPVFFVTLANTGALLHLVSLLTDRGLTVSQATRVVSMAGAAALLGRATAGYLMDAFFGPWVAAATFLVSAIGIGLLALNGPQWVAMVGTICIAFSLGAESDTVGYLVGRYFGLPTYGRVYGYVFSLFALGSGLGTYAMGFCYDLVGSYRPALVISAALVVGSAATIASLGPYEFPPQKRRPSSKANAAEP
jgi:MFS family permease